MEKLYPFSHLPSRERVCGSLLHRRRKWLLTAFLLIFSLSISFGTHFRAGTVTWTRVSETATTVTIRLNVSLSWRLGTAQSNAVFSISGGNTGSVAVPLTNVSDPSGGWTNSTGSANVTLIKTTVLTTIRFIGCCKISTLLNNPDGQWNVFTVLNTGASGSGPVSTMPAIINMPAGADPATYHVPASDPDPGSTISYRLATREEMAQGTNPPGLSIDASTGELRFYTVDKQVGDQYNAVLVVTDNDGNQLLLDFMINVTGPSNPPAFAYSVTPANGAEFTVMAGTEISFPIAAVDADPGSFVNLSVAGLPPYITVANFSDASLPATGNPAYTTFRWTPGAEQINHTVVLNFIATDDVGVQASTSVTIRVSAEPAPEFIDPTPGEATFRQIIPGVEHVDEIVASSSLGSDVSIGFATGIPAEAVLSPGLPTPGANPGTVSFSWTPTPADFGQKDITFQAVIASAPTIFSTRSYSLIVNTPPEFSSTPVLAVNDGEVFTYEVAINDPDIPYGDMVDVVARSLPAWLTLTNTGNGTALLTGTPAFENGGINTVTLEAEDTYHHGNPGPVIQQFNINVITCTDPVITCPEHIIAASQPGTCGASVDFSASVSGAPDPTVVYAIGTVIIASPHVFPVGTTEVTATASNTCSASACTFQVTVNDSEAPVISASSDVETGNDDGECSAVVTVSATAADNCTSDLRPTGIRSDGLELTAPYPVGTTTITWAVDDMAGNSAQEVVQTVIVNNMKPVIESVVPSSSLMQINKSFTLTTAFVDNNVKSASIDWDDLTSETIADPSSGFVATHSYAASGLYFPTVTITDACGETSEYTYDYIVVYDPSCGFVTGGGWITSPAGAYVPDPSLTGKANFGFVAKYPKESSPPRGHTEFHFRAGNLKFRSTSYEWLVINDYKAIYRGVGTINGSGNYTLMITAIDGDRQVGGADDRIRISISDGSNVVYDNEQGAAIDAEDAAVLGGGSIVIHAGETRSTFASTMKTRPVPDLTGETAFGIYPNPVRETIFFTYRSASALPFAVQLMDLQGKNLKEKAYEVSPDDQYSMEIHDAKLKPGFYFLKVQQGAGVRFLRVLKE